METPTQANMSCGRITGEVHCTGEGLWTRWMKSQSVCQMRTCTLRNLHTALKAKRFPNDRREKPSLLVLGSAFFCSCLCDPEKACSRACFLWDPEVYKQTLWNGRWENAPFQGLPHWLEREINEKACNIWNLK